jgi:hypothetical protein
MGHGVVDHRTIRELEQFIGAWTDIADLVRRVPRRGLCRMDIDLQLDSVVVVRVPVEGVLVEIVGALGEIEGVDRVRIGGEIRIVDAVLVADADIVEKFS